MGAVIQEHEQCKADPTIENQKPGILTSTCQPPNPKILFTLVSLSDKCVQPSLTAG